MQGKFEDLTGRVFGALKVLRRGKNSKHQRHSRWCVVCECGNKRLVLGHSLMSGVSRSCGCGRSTTRWKHGLWRTLQYTIWSAAKKRAKVSGIPFHIGLEDVSIPKKCPIFGFVLKPSKGPGCSDRSPSLDRIVNSRGYVKGNVWVISGKANRAKSNLTLKELKQLIKMLSKELRKNGRP